MICRRSRRRRSAAVRNIASRERTSSSGRWIGIRAGSCRVVKALAPIVGMRHHQLPHESENPPATKRHKNRREWEVLRESQKDKGRCAKKLGHIGQQASGEGGIRTLGDVAATPVFEPYPPGRADTRKHGVFAVLPPPARARIRRCIRLSRTHPRPAASHPTPWVSAADHGVAKACQEEGESGPSVMLFVGWAADGRQVDAAVASG
jgi:hypothetical protein